jgi:hypothetical protein
MQGFVQPAIKRRFWYRAVKHVDTSPFLKIIMVGCCEYETGAEFTFGFGIHFTKRTLPLRSSATSSKMGAKLRHGPPGRPEIDDNREIVLQQFIQRLTGRIDHLPIKQVVTTASAFSRFVDTIVRDAIERLAAGTNGIHN